MKHLVAGESDSTDIHRVYRTDWWPVAKAIAETGHDCTVLDPDAEDDESFFDGNAIHGVIQIRTHSGLGWTVLVSQTETEEFDEGNFGEGNFDEE